MAKRKCICITQKSIRYHIKTFLELYPQYLYQVSLAVTTARYLLTDRQEVERHSRSREERSAMKTEGLLQGKIWFIHLVYRKSPLCQMSLLVEMSFYCRNIKIFVLFSDVFSSLT